MRIGFLFNHDQIHQIAHSLPIALELAKGAVDVEIIIATTTPRIADEVARLVGPQPRPNLFFVKLTLQQSITKLLAASIGKVIPASKLLVYRDNLAFFASLDVLVVAEKTSLILKTRYGLDHLKLIHTRHGAGDRAIGFNKASARFDHVLVAGPAIRQRLISDAGVAPDRISIVGYPKFDLFADESWQGTFEDPDRPLVVYNPHVSPHLSSWYDMGVQVLEWFASQTQYNLIFAPHIMLFERPFALTIDKLKIGRPGKIPKHIRTAPNIHIDIGSRLSTTMAYVNRADIYLGDVSSQVYEFLLRPRPCVFIDAHRQNWKNDPNFAFWNAGQVIDGVDQLALALDRAEKLQTERFAAVQQKMFCERFDLGSTPSSKRAAAAVAKVGGLGFVALA
jgi:hypothetical protein